LSGDVYSMNVNLYRVLYVKGENAIIMLKILVTTVQNLCTPEIHVLPPSADFSTRNVCVKAVSLCTPLSRMGTGGINRLFLNFDTRYRYFVTSLSRSFFYVLLRVVFRVGCLLCVLVITVLHAVCSGNILFL
jgi:hypothetical protein